MSTAEDAPRLFVIAYRESDRVGAEANGDNLVPLLAWGEMPKPGPMDPDCRDNNKHRACTGRAWDDDADELTDCACTCHDPRQITVTSYGDTEPTFIDVTANPRR